MSKPLLSNPSLETKNIKNKIKHCLLTWSQRCPPPVQSCLCAYQCNPQSTQTGNISLMAALDLAHSTNNLPTMVCAAHVCFRNGPWPPHKCSRSRPSGQSPQKKVQFEKLLRCLFFLYRPRTQAERPRTRRDGNQNCSNHRQ